MSSRALHPALPWIGVLAAPFAWVVQLVSGYAIQEAGCAPITGSPVLTASTEPWIAGIGIAAIVVSIAGGLAAFASRRAATLHTDRDPRGRIAFMGDIGLVTSLIFVLVIILGVVAVPSLDACDLG